MTTSGKARQNTTFVSFLLFSASFLLSLYLVTLDVPPGGDGFEVMGVARSLVRDGSFANPFMGGTTGPTAHTPPLYPAYLAFLIRLSGDQFHFGLLMILSVVLVHALHNSLLPAISELFFQDRRPGVFAALISIVLPVFQIVLVREYIFVATGLMIFCLLARRVVESRLNDQMKSGLLGLACGVLALLNPSSVLVCFAWFVFLQVRRKAAWKTIVRLSAGFAAGVVLMCLPWTVRNYTQLRGVFFIRSNFGLELFEGNNECSAASLAANVRSGCHQATHPGANELERAHMSQIGELAYYREKQAAAVAWIRKNPGRFLRLTFERAVLFWFPETNPGFPAPYVYATWLATALSFIGLYRLLSTSAPIGWFLLITSVAYSGVYYLVNHDACYRYPILWLTLLCAGHLASEKFHPALAQRYGEALERWRLAPIPRPQTSQRALPSLSANARVGNRVSSPSGFAT